MKKNKKNEKVGILTRQNSYEQGISYSRFVLLRFLTKDSGLGRCPQQFKQSQGGGQIIAHSSLEYRGQQTIGPRSLVSIPSTCHIQDMTTEIFILPSPAAI